MIGARKGDSDTTMSKQYCVCVCVWVRVYMCACVHAYACAYESAPVPLCVCMCAYHGAGTTTGSRAYIYPPIDPHVFGPGRGVKSYYQRPPKMTPPAPGYPRPVCGAMCRSVWLNYWYLICVLRWHAHRGSPRWRPFLLFVFRVHPCGHLLTSHSYERSVKKG